MVRVYRETTKDRRNVIKREYICSECGAKCDPKSYDLRDHYFETRNKGGYCWECLQDVCEFEDVKE